MGEFERLLALSPALVAFTQCSNVLGTINDAEKLCSMAKRAGAVTVVDAAQSAPHMPIDVQRMGCDFLAFSGHKMLAPTGIGALYGRRELLDSMDPFQSGGDMIKEVHLDGARWNDVPYKFEAGTTNIADAIGLGVAVEYLTALGMENVEEARGRAPEVRLREDVAHPQHHDLRPNGPRGQGRRDLLQPRGHPSARHGVDPR